MRLTYAFRIFKRTLITYKTDELLVSSTDTAVVMTLNRPEYLNAITAPILFKVRNTLGKLEQEKKLVIIKGNREKIFSCGGDVKALCNKVHNDGKLEVAMRFIRLAYMTIYMTKYCKLPYIALIDGITMGTGLGLAVHGQYRIATENTVAAMPENRIGLFTDMSGTYFLSRLPQNFGVYMGVTGARVKGKTAVRVGLATHFVPQARLRELETSLVQCADEAQIDRVIEQFQEPTDDRPADDNIHHIERCFGAATVEEIIERLQAVKNDWSRRVLKSFTESSPGSTKISLRAIQRGAQLNLAQCLQMEYRIMNRRSPHHDFAEGVRALLLEKDNKPKWNPANWEEANEAFVESYFARLPPGQELDLETTEFD